MLAAMTAPGAVIDAAALLAYAAALDAANPSKKLPTNLVLEGDAAIKKQFKDDVTLIVLVGKLATPIGNKMVAPIIVRALRDPTGVFSHSAMRVNQTQFIAELTENNGLTLEYLLSNPDNEALVAGATLSERSALQARENAIKSIVAHTAQRIMIQEVDALRKVYNQQGTLSFAQLHAYLDIHASQFLLPWEAAKIARDKKRARI